MSVSTIQQFLKELASSAPTPGGGSTAALSGAVGASLVSMVCQLTIGKKRYADVQTEMHEILKVSEELQQKLIAMIDEDAKAFDLVMDAFKMPKKTAEEKSARRTAIQEGSKQATIVPMKVVLACARVIELGKVVAEKGNKNALSDAGAAVLNAQAGMKTAALNVRINLGSIKDESFVNEYRMKLDDVLADHDTLANEIYKIVQSKL